MTKYRATIMEHNRITLDHFYNESADVCRESLLSYFKVRLAKAVEGRAFRASIKDFSAFELEVLVSALEEVAPRTFVGHHHRAMARAIDGKEES